jgi:hypothetical protein
MSDAWFWFFNVVLPGFLFLGSGVLLIIELIFAHRRGKDDQAVAQLLMLVPDLDEVPSGWGNKRLCGLLANEIRRRAAEPRNSSPTLHGYLVPLDKADLAKLLELISSGEKQQEKTDEQHEQQDPTEQ